VGNLLTAALPAGVQGLCF